jgi:hypothetical protein
MLLVLSIDANCIGHTCALSIDAHALSTNHMFTYKSEAKPKCKLHVYYTPTAHAFGILLSHLFSKIPPCSRAPTGQAPCAAYLKTHTVILKIGTFKLTAGADFSN